MLDEQSLRTRDRFLRNVYEYSNKCGSSLARLFQPKSMSFPIMAMHFIQHGLLHRNVNIAEAFQAFYSDLYNLQHSCGAPALIAKISKLSEYLSRIKLPP